jgi:DNA-binding transcriptional MerR regulator
MWTLDELVERVRAALAEAEYPGAPNGRVRDVPDRRAIRWYATTGLVDRPAAMRGRVALYGPRHLLQLVAVKRRQAEGRSLAEIQAELAGATDATLAGIARVPDDLLTAAAEPPTVTRRRFWADPPVSAEPAVDAEPDTVTTLTGVPLGAGAVLLLPVPPRPDDLPAISAAARPLLDVLADRGLLGMPTRRSPFLDLDPLTDDPRADRIARTQRSSS